MAEDDSVLLLRGDFLYDQRIIQNMVGAVGLVMEADTPEGPRPVAAHVTEELADRMEAILTAGGHGEYPGRFTP